MYSKKDLTPLSTSPDSSLLSHLTHEYAMAFGVLTRTKAIKNPHDDGKTKYPWVGWLWEYVQ